MNRSILLFGAAREQSTRCPDKIMRPFADTTLYDVYLRKLEELSKSEVFSRVVIGVARSDERMWERAAESEVEVAERSEESVARGIRPRGEELHFLDQFDESHVLFFNGCLPFFSASRVERAARQFLATDAISLTYVQPIHNWFWTHDTIIPINNLDARCLSTQGCTPLNESVHAVNIYPRERMLRQNVRWSYSNDRDPLVRVMHGVDPVELLDVDDEEQHDYCAWKWARRQRASEDGAT